MTQTDWINLQRSRHAVRWIVAYCLALREHRPLSDIVHRRSFRFVENNCGGWNLAPFVMSESVS